MTSHHQSGNRSLTTAVQRSFGHIIYHSIDSFQCSVSAAVDLQTKTPEEPTTDGAIKVEKMEKCEERREERRGESDDTPPSEDKPTDMSCAPSTPEPHKAGSKQSDG